MHKGGSVESISALTGLRGAAALWVASYHGGGVFLTAVPLPEIVTNLLRSGWLAVDLFFVLSGFIMCHVHLHDLASPSRAETARFLKLRIARIYPAHAIAALCWLPVLLISVHAFGMRTSESLLNNFNGRTLFYALTLTNGWGFPHSQGWNLPSWSVGSEWFAYLCFPLAAIFLNRMKSTGANIVTIGCVSAACTLLALCLNGGRQYMLPESLTTIRVVSEFVIGCCAYGVFRSARRHRCGGVFAWSGLLLCLTLAAAPHHHILDGVFILGFATLIIGLASSQTRLSKMLSTRPAIYLGKISYSVYLMHALVIVMLHRIFQSLTAPRPVLWIFEFTIYLLGAVIAGDLLWRLVEEPSRVWLRRKWIGTTASHADAGPVPG